MPAINRIPHARPDELQGLLTDSSETERGETLFCIRTQEGGTKTEVQDGCGWEALEDDIVLV